MPVVLHVFTTNAQENTVSEVKRVQGQSSATVNREPCGVGPQRKESGLERGPNDVSDQPEIPEFEPNGSSQRQNLRGCAEFALSTAGPRAAASVTKWVMATVRSR